MRNTFILTVLVVTVLSPFTKNQMAINDSKNQNSEIITLDSTKWRLTRICNTDSFVLVSGTKAFIHFNTGDGNVNGNGSCNSFGGKMSVDGKSLKLGNIFSTKMYCNEVQATENEFFSHLQKVTRYTIKENKLILFSDENAVLEFEAG